MSPAYQPALRTALAAQEELKAPSAP
jgi:hypothetical protein